jgi:6,7-dimethyl-8-ribityllumazine synthase
VTVHQAMPGRIPVKAGVAMAEFNEAITSRLADAAVAALEDFGISDIVVARVPGALELGLIAAGLIDAGCEVVVAVGAVIKGETDHYEYVAGEASRALTEVSLRSGRPVGNAVLTVRDYEHAVDRSLPGPSNKGHEAAHAAVEAFRVLSGLAVL